MINHSHARDEPTIMEKRADTLCLNYEKKNPL